MRDNVYVSGPGNNWIAMTYAHRETLTWPASSSTKASGTASISADTKADLVYAGKVDHGFDKSSAGDLQKRLKPLIRKTQPNAKRIAH